jgi:hypothetical protein
MRRAQSPNPANESRKKNLLYDNDMDSKSKNDKIMRSKSPRIEKDDDENGLFSELEHYMKRTDRKVSNMIRKRNLEIDIN